MYLNHFFEKHINSNNVYCNFNVIYIFNTNYDKGRLLYWEYVWKAKSLTYYLFWKLKFSFFDTCSLQKSESVTFCVYFMNLTLKSL